MNLPKVLILNQPFNNQTGGGITLSNLFSGWDKDKLAVVCRSYLLGNADTNICNTYYQLGQKEHKFTFPFNLIKRKHYSGPLKLDEKAVQNVKIAKSPLRVKIILDYFNPLLIFFGLNNSISKIELSKDLCEWLNDFKPDLIYAVATTRESIKFILIVQSYLKKPLVFHMMDDWIVADKGPFKHIEFNKNNREFIKLLDKTDVLMSISEGMAEEYKRRYGKDSITFHNPIDIDFWKRYQRKNYELSNPASILYAGRVGLGIDKSLELIARAIQRVNKNLDLSIKFILQTKEEPLWISNYECVVHKRFVAYDDLPKVFAEADFLILPYDFSSQSIKYIGYSMPTKASEYMISGTPIIIFSPAETALVKYAFKYKWAKIITRNDINTLCEAISLLIKDKQVRAQIGQNAINIAEENHSSLKVRHNFQAVICSVANKDRNNKILFANE